MDTYNFDELNLGDQISIVKQYAKLYEDSKAQTVLMQLLLMIKELDMPELIGIPILEGEA
tara:strand:- start:2655 stop:2834 length:180 start_codon:yes stop_codon:yes gene_type:complete